jgi:H+/Cl- antiporter ClcA
MTHLALESTDSGMRRLAHCEILLRVFQSLSAMVSLLGLASAVAGGVADSLVVERRIRTEIKERHTARLWMLALALMVWAVSILLFILPTLLDSGHGADDSMVGFLILPLLISWLAIRSWTKNGRRIKVLERALRGVRP